MFRTLYAKLALVLALLLVTLGIVYALFSLYAGQLFLQEVTQRLNRDLARELLMREEHNDSGRLNAAEVQKLFSHYMHVNPAIEIYLLDTEGKIIAFEAPEMKIKRRQISLEPIKQFLSGNFSYPLLGDDPRSEDMMKTFTAAAYPFSGEPQQYLYIVLGGEDYDHVKDLLQDSYFQQISLVAVIATVTFGLLVGLFMFNMLTRRLNSLTDLMSDFRLSGFKRFHPYSEGDTIARPDEIDTLGESYNEMAQRIIEQMEALEQKDNLRRNLVANVSHDLRTPLASLQGYLETLQLKTATLPVEERRRYLDIAYTHSQRLTLLVSELFELSKLEAKEHLPDIEPVAIGELVMDVAQKFQLRCEEKGIHLAADIPDALPFVGADIAMLDRVLENLVGNAIEHCSEKGEIIIGLQAEGEGVRLSVCNSGEVIDEADIPYLFERFYQSPKNRHGKGAGLGLAIVKRIVELHHSQIEVTRSANKGNCFSFSLTGWQRT